MPDRRPLTDHPIFHETLPATSIPLWPAYAVLAWQLLLALCLLYTQSYLGAVASGLFVALGGVFLAQVRGWKLRINRRNATTPIEDEEFPDIFVFSDEEASPLQVGSYYKVLGVAGDRATLACSANGRIIAPLSSCYLLAPEDMEPFQLWLHSWENSHGVHKEKWAADRAEDAALRRSHGDSSFDYLYDKRVKKPHEAFDRCDAHEERHFQQERVRAHEEQLQRLINAGAAEAVLDAARKNLERVRGEQTDSMPARAV